MAKRTAARALFTALPALAALALILPGAAPTAEVLGQVASSGLQVEGLSAPSGTTLVSPILVATEAEPGLVYLSSGKTLALGPHTEISLASTSRSGEELGAAETHDLRQVHMAVHRGVVAYRSDDGEIVSVGRADAVYFDQEQVIGEGRRVTGLVAVLTATAAAGDSVLQVDATDRVSSDAKVLIRTADGAIQEVHCIESVDAVSLEVVLENALRAGFPAGAQLVQGAAVQEALDRGDAEDFCRATGAAGWSAAKKLAVAGATVLGAYGLYDYFEDDDGRPVDEEEEVSKRRP